MDRSLDEIIADRPSRPSNSGRSRARRNNNFPRDGVRKSTRDDRANLDLDWVHDKFEDDRDTQRSYRSRNRRRSPDDGYDNAPTEAKIRVDNLHYDLNENDLEDLFSRIGPITDLRMRYDRAGRSDGIAFVTYARLSDARNAIREFDGANAKGQPIRLTLLPGAPGKRAARNPFDNVQKPQSSLLDRVERPSRGRDDRSLSPVSDVEGTRGGASRARGGHGRPDRRSDVSKPPPENIDRYVPGQGARSPRRRGEGGRGGGRRPGARRENKDQEGHRLVQGRPRKTQEELDQEMEDYWGANNAATDEAPANNGATVSEPAAAVDDIDMIE